MNYDDLIGRERQKAIWLCERLRETERRIDTLIQMQDDPVDRLIEASGSVSSAVAAVASETPSEPHAFVSANPAPKSEPVARKRHKRVPENWAQVLTFIAGEGKALAPILDFTAQNGIVMSAGTLRTGLANYRKDFGFVENPRPGFYRATDAALAAIKAQKGESPTTGHGEAFSLQPSPGQGPQPSVEGDGT